MVKDLFAKKLVSVIFSEPGVGKTILAMDIAAKLTKGEAIFNHYRVERPMKEFYRIKHDKQFVDTNRYYVY